MKTTINLLMVLALLLGLVFTGPAQPVSAQASLIISPEILPNAAFQTLYEQQLAASGGVKPYTFSLVSGALPEDITLTSIGVLSGYPDVWLDSPTPIGTYPVTIQVEDANGAVASQSYDFVLDKGVPEVTVYTATDIYWSYPFNISVAVRKTDPTSGGAYLLGGTVAFYIDNQIVPGCEAVLFQNSDYQCSVVANNLTGGTHTLRADYTPTELYANYYTAGSGSSEFTVQPRQFVVQGSIFDDRNENGVYDPDDQGLFEAGWTINLDENCDGGVDYIRTTTSGGIFDFGNIPSNGQCYRLTVVGEPGYQQTTQLNDFVLTEHIYVGIGFYYPTITLSPSDYDLPEGDVGVEYNQVFSASGGTAPYTYTIAMDDVRSSFPVDLNLSPEGVLSGTPTGTGVYQFSILAEDSTGAIGRRYYSLSIKTDGIFTFTSSSNPSAPGDEVTFTMSASGSEVYPPIGSVTIFSDGTPIDGCSDLVLNVLLDEFGEVVNYGNYPATCITAALETGTHEITATYTDMTGMYHDANRSLTQQVGEIPAPTLSSISPASVVVGAADLKLVVSGSGFTASTVVRWNGEDLATSFYSDTSLGAIIPAGKLASPQTAQISVYSGGKTSNILPFFVTESETKVIVQAADSGTDPSASITAVTSSATGDGLLAVSGFSGNPGGTPNFEINGSFFDVYTAPESSFSQVEIVACGMTAKEKLYWWDGTAWVKAIPQTYDAYTGCITLLVTDSSSPTLSQLQGTYFVAGVGDGENTAPVANPGGPYLGAISTTIAFDGNLSSDPENDPLTYAWNFGDGSDISASAEHIYTAASIYDVCLTVNDGSLASEPACTIAVVYDPSAGFVTGGGWIDSPAGAYMADENLTGKATFGFVSKYQKGAKVPTGNTEFQFQAGGFKFYSSAYDWLVVSKDQVTAQFKGSGTVNETLAPNGSAYKFMLWAGDGAASDAPDTFRIRIWWEDADAVEHVVYDNGFNQTIGGGSIVVHTGK